MLRKLTIILLSGVICLLGVTSVLAAKYNEAPALKARVAAGELAAVEKRLPEEPLVVTPTDEIGEYGGTLRLVMLGSPSGFELNTYWFLEPFVQKTIDRQSLYPNVLKSYEVSDDYKTFTLFLRKGLKWSDGQLATADDLMFWYEDKILNDELTPVKPGHLKSGGELLKLEKVDDYTVRFRFSAPYGNFIETIASSWAGLNYPFSWGAFLPKHYLERYHIKYNSKANELAKKEGFDHWYQLFNKMCGSDVVGRPTLQAWVLKEISPDYAVFERNPYYWKVDTAGNQLPYIDRVESKLIPNTEAYKIAVLGGEADFAVLPLTLEDYPLLKRNEEKGNYQVYDWYAKYCSAVVYLPYQTYKEPVMREIMQDVRFRRALSLAINREEINQLVYFGKGTPGQFAIPPDSKYHVPEYWQNYTQYDPEKANQLLDEMGLEWDRNHIYRLRPDGETLFVKIQGTPLPVQTPTHATAKLVRDYWEAIGVKTDFDFPGNIVGRFLADEVSMITHWGNFVPALMYTGNLFGSYAWWCNPWYAAFTEGGREQAEKAGASEDVIRVFELVQEFASALDEQEKMRIVNEISSLWDKNLWGIGTIGGGIPKPCVVKNYLKNVPKVSMTNDGYNQQTIPAQYFISR